MTRFYELTDRAIRLTLIINRDRDLLTAQLISRGEEFGDVKR